MNVFSLRQRTKQNAILINSIQYCSRGLRQERSLAKKKKKRKEGKKEKKETEGRGRERERERKEQVGRIKVLIHTRDGSYVENPKESTH